MQIILKDNAIKLIIMIINHLNKTKWLHVFNFVAIFHLYNTTCNYCSFFSQLSLYSSDPRISWLLSLFPFHAHTPLDRGRIGDEQCDCFNSDGEVPWKWEIA